MANKVFSIEQFRAWGRKGGLMRRLSPAQARRMVRAREAKRLRTPIEKLAKGGGK